MNPQPIVLRADFTRIVAFGDSLTDTGNVLNLLGNLAVGPPYFQGCCSNGSLYVERLAERLAIASPTINPQQLFVPYGGANDFLGSQNNPSVPVTNLSSYISALSTRGSASFLVPNLPPLGPTQTEFVRAIVLQVERRLMGFTLTS